MKRSRSKSRKSRSKSPSIRSTELSRQVLGIEGLRKHIAKMHMEVEGLRKQARKYASLKDKQKKIEQKLAPYRRHGVTGSLSFLNPTRYDLHQASPSVLKAKRELDHIQKELGKLTFKQRMELERAAKDLSPKSKSKSKSGSLRSKSIKCSKRSRSKSRSRSPFWRIC